MSKPYVFVDIETDGLYPPNNRIIEVAAIRVEGEEIVDEFVSLVNPEHRISHFSRDLTGISDDDLIGAPTFAEISGNLMDIFNGAVFVAHNVDFDLSFIKSEFNRIGIEYKPKKLCTVKLSRRIYPEMKHHGLDDLINFHGFPVENRHRAYDDALVLVKFWKKIHESYDKQVKLF